VSFASPTFLIFLPVVLLVYHGLRRRPHKYSFLLLASWVFYLSWNPRFVWVIILVSLVDYSAGLLIESAATPRARRGWLMLSLASNLGLLGFFKYTNFLVHSGSALGRWLGLDVPDWSMNVILPLGISFHTFQGISYTLDVYRGKIRAVHSFVDFALFVAFFPQLVAGPIVRAVEFLPQMTTPPRVTAQQVTDGVHWLLIGLFKKVFLADRLAQFLDPIFAHPGLYDAATLRWAVLAYAGQIYCDFSGYSDMAIGCAKWFGFELPENFRFPYLSGSIAEFWKRWHISLSTWMRDYLYIGLGGSRRGNLRTHVNLLVTMTLCGLWHGATWNYVLWGFYNGVLLTLHRAYDRMLCSFPRLDALRRRLAYRVLAVAVTFLLVAVGLVLVRSESWAGCWRVEQALLGAGVGHAVLHVVPVFVPVLLLMIAVGHLFSGLRDRRCGILDLAPLPRATAYVAVVVLLLVFAPGVTKTFIYFQF
jgi:alginate O-acetyltransferase complex protein AlgI